MGDYYRPSSTVFRRLIRFSSLGKKPRRKSGTNNASGQLSAQFIGYLLIDYMQTIAIQLVAELQHLRPDCQGKAFQGHFAVIVPQISITWTGTPLKNTLGWRFILLVFAKVDIRI